MCYIVPYFANALNCLNNSKSGLGKERSLKIEEMSGKGKHRETDDEEPDDTFFYRYPSLPAAEPPSSAASKSSSLSGGLAPSKSTVYVSNIDYNLTNSDLHTIFSTFGKVAKVTVLKDRLTRLNKGVNFILFVNRDDAAKAVKGMNKKILNGRTLSASIAEDNGRATEFIRKRIYKDKSRCYECGEEGHLSYECPRNVLGARERPVTKKARRGGGRGRFEEEEEVVEFERDDWASAVEGEAVERERWEVKRERMGKKRKGYFSDRSDEEEEEED